MYKRVEYQIITSRLKEPRKFIQVVMGTRQVGKIVGDGGISAEEFLSMDIRNLFK